MRRALTHEKSMRRWGEAQTPDGGIDPLRASVAIATHLNPMLDPAKVIARIDGFAAEARAIVGKGNSTWGAVNHVLFDRHGFTGNTERYSDPRNSYIDQVLHRKTGLPILLSLLWVETALRAGGKAYGVGLPGHFVAGIEEGGEGGERVIVDAFHAGTRLSVSDCEQIAVASGAAWTEETLLPLDGRRWALRMLMNLRNGYGQMGDAANLAAVLEQMVMLEPALGNQQEELKRLYAYLDQQAARNN
jgi:regulator of sirC expression with transglutaminase-like and TPR domain